MVGGKYYHYSLFTDEDIEFLKITEFSKYHTFFLRNRGLFLNYVIPSVLEDLGGLERNTHAHTLTLLDDRHSEQPSLFLGPQLVHRLVLIQLRSFLSFSIFKWEKTTYEGVVLMRLCLDCWLGEREGQSRS